MTVIWYFFTLMVKQYEKWKPMLKIELFVKDINELFAKIGFKIGQCISPILDAIHNIMTTNAKYFKFNMH